MFLVFDTETTGLPKRWNAPISDLENWPRCVQIAWQLHDFDGKLIEYDNYVVAPNGFNIPYESEQIHGISTELALNEGTILSEVLDKFEEVLSKSKYIIGHNLGFDINIMGAELLRLERKTSIAAIPVLDTCTEETALLCELPGGRGGKFKLPTLTELYKHLFSTDFKEAHNATADVEATARIFFGTPTAKFV